MTKRFLIKYGGHLSRISNKEEEWIECESDRSLGSLLSEISEKYSGSLGGRPSGHRFLFLTTLNGEFIPSSYLDDILLRDGDVVMIFLPASGG